MNGELYALITGASQGIGRAMARELAQRGHNLALHSLPGEDLTSQGQELSASFGIKVSVYEIDLAVTEGPQNLFNAVQADGIVINILINNAGVGIAGPLDSYSAEVIDKVIFLNIRALTMLTFLFTPVLKRSGSYILNVSSLGSYVPAPYKSVYLASKSYIYHFSRSLEVEFKGTKVRVCVLVPGGVKTNSLVIRRVEEAGWLGKSSALEAGEVAATCIAEMFKGKSVVIPGSLARFLFNISLILPLGVMNAVSRRVLRRETSL